jgi:hypothetical protein
MNLFQSLWHTAQLVHPEPTYADAFSRFKYFIRGCATPRLTADWFSVLASGPLRFLTSQHPYLFSKLQRPCLHRRLSCRARLELLMIHYGFVDRFLEEQFLEQILAPTGWPLAALPMPEPDRFSLRLFYWPHSKEGELCIGLYDRVFQQFLFMMAFCVTHGGQSGGFEFFIGGLQGTKLPNQRELIIELTRSLHGLRPKALLLFALQQLAQSWGISRIRAVAAQEHIYRHYRKRIAFHANYDEFWAESHGVILPDGNFELPVVAPARNLEELPRKKRPIYRRRYEMLEAIAREIAAHSLYKTAAVSVSEPSDHARSPTSQRGLSPVTFASRPSPQTG